KGPRTRDRGPRTDEERSTKDQGPSASADVSQRRGSSPVTADDRAFDRSGEAGINPVAGEEHSRKRRFDRRPLRLPGGDRERRALFADDDGTAQLGALHRRQRNSQLTKRQVDKLLVGLTHQCRRAARDERQMRAGFAEQRALVEHPLHRAAGQADKAVRRHRAIEPEIDGDDRRCIGGLCRSQYGFERGRPIRKYRWQRVPRCRADDGPWLQNLVAYAHREMPVTRHARGRIDSHSSCRTLDVLARWNRVQLIERLQREAKRAVAPVVREHASQHTSERGPRRLVYGLIQRGNRQRFPQQLDETRRLPMPHQPLPYRLTWRPLIDMPHVEQRRAIAPADALPTNHAAQQMQWRRQRRTSEGRHAPVPIDDVDVQITLHVHVAERVQAAKKRERLVIAADEHVLTIVHTLSRPWIDERCGPASERRPGFEDENSDALFGEGCGGTEAGKATTDHDDINAQCRMPNAQCLTLESVGLGTGARRRAPSSVCSQMRRAITARFGRGTRMRDEKTS